MFSLRVIAHLFLCFSAGRSFATKRLFCRPTSSCLFAAVATENSTVSTVWPPTSVTSILANDPEFVKPDRDLREYRYVRLPNNLEALLVSTSNIKSSEDMELNDDEEDDDEENGNTAAQVEAAAVHVQAGHFDDTIPGLAHFHERKLLVCCMYYCSLSAFLTSLQSFLSL